MREAHGGGPTLTAGAQCTQATQPARRGSIRALQSPPTPPLPTNRWHSPGGCTDAAPGGVTDSGHGATSPAPITTWRSLALAAALRHAVTSDPAGAKLLCGTGSLLCLHPRGGHTWSSLQPLSVEYCHPSPFSGPIFSWSAEFTSSKSLLTWGSKKT